jgi:hypothetical protein
VLLPSGQSGKQVRLSQIITRIQPEESLSEILRKEQREDFEQIKILTHPFILTLQIVHNCYKSEIVNHLRGNETLLKK